MTSACPVELSHCPVKRHMIAAHLSFSLSEVLNARSIIAITTIQCYIDSLENSTMFADITESAQYGFYPV